MQSISTERLWIFAYGSLLFRPGFDYVSRRRAVVDGYARSFSQASPDHRGTPDRPGRVLTLVERVNASTVGAVYAVAAPYDALLLELDRREQAGYQRAQLEVTTDGGSLSAVTWIAQPGNAYDVGELPLEALAAHVRASAGPSGRNDEYVFRLERALLELDATDPHVSELSRLLRR